MEPSPLSICDLLLRLGGWGERQHLPQTPSAQWSDVCGLVGNFRSTGIGLAGAPSEARSGGLCEGKPGKSAYDSLPLDLLECFGEVLAGDALGAFEQAGYVPLIDDLPALVATSWAEVDHVVSMGDHPQVMFDHN